MLRLSELKLPLDHSEADLVLAVCQRLRLSPAQLKGHRLVKRSVDARKRQAISLGNNLTLMPYRKKSAKIGPKSAGLNALVRY